MKRAILDNHKVSEMVNSNIQGMLNFLPGRYGDYELLYETVISSMNALMVLEDLVVFQHVREKFVNVKKDSEEWNIVQTIPSSGVESWLCSALSLVRSVEVTVEMAFCKHYPASRWNLVQFLEMFKALLKLLLLVRNGGGMLLRQGHPLRSAVNVLSMAGPKEQDQVVVMEEEGQKAKVNMSETMGELLYIARPVVHLW
jgi:hypothetical protein